MFVFSGLELIHSYEDGVVRYVGEMKNNTKAVKKGLS